MRLDFPDDVVNPKIVNLQYIPIKNAQIDFGYGMFNPRTLFPYYVGFRKPTTLGEQMKLAEQRHSSFKKWLCLEHNKDCSYISATADCDSYAIELEMSYSNAILPRETQVLKYPFGFLYTKTATNVSLIPIDCNQDKYETINELMPNKFRSNVYTFDAVLSRLNKFMFTNYRKAHKIMMLLTLYTHRKERK